MDDEYIPRRLLRFYRKKPVESEVREKSAKLAVKEVDNFVEQNKRYPNREEIDKIAESVFEQLKKEFSEEDEKKFENDIDLDFLDKEKTELRRKRSMKKEEKEEEKIPEKQETAAIIIPEEQDETEKYENINNIEKIAELDEVASLEDEISDNDDFDNIEKEMEEKEGICPRCKSKTEEIIFCPQCGEAFCNHCAKAIENLPDAIKYVCPNCNTLFKKRKINK
ncbi:MAG: hypothetical protein QXZ13_03005 [Candidatus Diapherotrites archaeon]